MKLLFPHAVLAIALLAVSQCNVFNQTPAKKSTSTSTSVSGENESLLTTKLPPARSLDPQQKERLRQLRQKLEAARALAVAQQSRSTTISQTRRPSLRVRGAQLLRLPSASGHVAKQATVREFVNSEFQQFVRSQKKSLALMANVSAASPASSVRAASALAPLDTELVTLSTLSSEGLLSDPKYPVTFFLAMEYALQGSVGGFDLRVSPRPAEGTPNSPVGRFLVPFFVRSPNLIFRVPGYIVGPIQIGWYEPEPDIPVVTKETGPYPITVTLQKLEMTPAHLPVTDPNDLFGYKWTNISPPISSNTSIPQPWGQPQTWSSSFTLKQQAGKTYLLADIFGGAELYNLDIPARLTDVVNIIRFSIEVHVPFKLGPTKNWTYYSGAVPVVVEPTGLVQLKCLPIAIIYQPPGDESIVDYSQSKTATVGITANFSDGTSTKFINDVSAQSSSDGHGAVSFSIPFFGPIGIGQGGASNFSWDNRTSKVDTEIVTTTNGMTISTGVSGEWQLGGNPPPGKGYVAPYWNDTFILTIHPQFALWDFMQPTQGNSSTSGVTADLLGLDLEGTMSVTVNQLDECANDQNVVIPIYTGASGNSEYLKRPECEALLALDPFYVGGQSSALSDIAVHESAFNLGSPGFSDTIKLTQSLDTRESTTLQSDFSTEIDSTLGGGYKFGSSWNYGGAGGNDTAGQTGSTTTSTKVDFSYSNGALRSGTLATTASRKLEDTGSKRQLPIIGSAFVDSRFGTWMFQGASPQTCFSNGQGDGCSTPCSNQSCGAPCKLASNDASQYVCPAVGSVTGTWSATTPATAKCGDTIAINGFGLSEVKDLLFEPDAGGQQVFFSPRSTIKIVSDDLVTAQLNAPGDRTYKVAVKTSPTSTPVVVGRISVTGACSAEPQ
jgi:hypothetical protein